MEAKSSTCGTSQAASCGRRLTCSPGIFWGRQRAVEIWSTRIGVVLAAALLLWLCVYWLRKFLEKGDRSSWFAGSLLASVGEAIAANPHVRELVAKHPLLRIRRKRLDRSSSPACPHPARDRILYILLLLAVVEDLLSIDRSSRTPA
jgi:hypothetical protein